MEGKDSESVPENKSKEVSEDQECGDCGAYLFDDMEECDTECLGCLDHISSK